jgi:hypothetical protein
MKRSLFAFAAILITQLLPVPPARADKVLGINSAGQRTLEAIELWNEPDLADLFFKPYKRESAEGATL